jgi:hypothetical protein
MFFVDAMVYVLRWIPLRQVLRLSTPDLLTDSTFCQKNGYATLAAMHREISRRDVASPSFRHQNNHDRQVRSAVSQQKLGRRMLAVRAGLGRCKRPSAVTVPRHVKLGARPLPKPSCHSLILASKSPSLVSSPLFAFLSPPPRAPNTLLDLQRNISLGRGRWIFSSQQDG